MTTSPSNFKNLDKTELPSRQRRIILDFLITRMFQIHEILFLITSNFTPPKKSVIKNFIEDLFDEIACGPLCYLIGMYYYQKFTENLPKEVKEQDDDCDFDSYYKYVYITCLILSSKVWEDRFAGNIDFYNCFKLEDEIDISMINYLEVLIMKNFDFRFHIPEEDFYQFLKKNKI